MLISKEYKTDFQFPLQEASECDNGKPGNDLIPIIVGCVLAGMVVIVLVAYLIGRRYQTPTPYQNLDWSGTFKYIILFIVEQICFNMDYIIPQICI